MNAIISPSDIIERLGYLMESISQLDEVERDTNGGIPYLMQIQNDQMEALSYLSEDHHRSSEMAR
jgi:hypothetical protein